MRTQNFGFRGIALNQIEFGNLIVVATCPVRANRVGAGRGQPGFLPRTEILFGGLGQHFHEFGERRIAERILLKIALQALAEVVFAEVMTKLLDDGGALAVSDAVEV